MGVTLARLEIAHLLVLKGWRLERSGILDLRAYRAHFLMLDSRCRVGQVDRIDRFHAWDLECDPALLTTPGVHVVGSPRRARPGWAGYNVPITSISTPQGGVISVSPSLVEKVRKELAPIDWTAPLGEPELERLRPLARRIVPYAFCLNGQVLYCDADSFRPVPGAAELLQRDDPTGRELYARFDGEIFVVRGLRNRIASWAALKLKSDDVWEIAVVTEAPYRGQGYAKQVVSAATQSILESGRMALYVHDRTNIASSRVCRGLGYIEYADQFFCEY
ncbi:MAG: GNAT family N-acetyltransferase [Chloroflexota bacterium]